MPHFTWDISLGNILASLAVVGAALKFHGDWITMSKQHQLMWIDYCKRHRIAYGSDLEGDDG